MMLWLVPLVLDCSLQLRNVAIDMPQSLLEHLYRVRIETTDSSGLVKSCNRHQFVGKFLSLGSEINLHDPPVVLRTRDTSPRRTS